MRGTIKHAVLVDGETVLLQKLIRRQLPLPIKRGERWHCPQCGIWFEGLDRMVKHIEGCHISDRAGRGMAAVKNRKKMMQVAMIA